MWSGQRLALAWIVWLGVVLALVIAGMASSLVLSHNADEVRHVFTRSNLLGLSSVILVPPSCLTLQWWVMHQRRRERRKTRA